MPGPVIGDGAPPARPWAAAGPAANNTAAAAAASFIVIMTFPFAWL
jgi:hypothetical protein